ncbi:TonB-dependent receptor [Sphingosinicella microcystinivorans]|uniref:TonB-dependent receptor n=1 Tax=Sphingosinicella microcystinivorans TaxID=335406 RepID=A0AAD1FZS7_SPHMI|nr:TonB-dependent receptor [Sphingosinicella microcystinivorans]RKS84592.1 TonB-dependent receptor [Sphingosinicella microcystinivorans]BBE33043.1 TonB-dependent receptor [Sphingosinicella microcystinivorans]
MSHRIRARFAAALFAVTALSTPAFAGTLVGTVIDAGGVRGLQGAEVELVELGRRTSAGPDGSFRFADVPSGSYTLRAVYAGADESRTSVSITEDGTTRTDIALSAGDDSLILVIGQQANLGSAISRQRAADGVYSVLTRDAVGQFPDQNVAESLRRLPGVNILNDQGEGRFVSIRGLDPELNSSSLNGVRLPAPESDVRSVALDVISSDLIESIEVKKSLTPDMDGDTIGASIEINTTSAFARKKDLLKLSAEGSYNDLTDHLSPKGAVDFSTKLSDNIGVAGGISYYKRKFATDNMEMDGWDEDDGVVYADTVEYRDYDVERERISASLSFDFKAGESTTLYVRGLYSQFDDQEYRRRLTFEMDEAPSDGSDTTAEFLSDGGEISVQRDLKDRFESQKIRSLTMGGETDAGPWKLVYSASWAKSSERENGSIDPVKFERKFEDAGEFGVRFDYSKPMFTGHTITAGNDLFLDPSEYEFDKAEITTLSDAQDEEYALKADVSRVFALGTGEFTVQGGVKSRWREKFYNGTFEVYDGFDGDSDLTLADVLGKQDYGLALIEPMPGKKSFRKFLSTNRDAFELDPFDTDQMSAESDYSVDEDILAAYLLGRWDSSTVRIIGGVRMERTKNRMTGNVVTLVEEGGEFGGEPVEDDTVFVTPQSFSRSYTDWLPSLTVRYEPVPNLVLRAAGYKNLMRPKLSSLAPRAVIEDNEGEFGNPDLKPYRAWNADLSVEYYFGRNAAVSAGVFYKDVKNYIIEYTVDGGDTGIPYNGQLLDEAKTWINGDTAKIRGFEFSYSQAFDFLPAPFDGLLAQFNYTYTDAKGRVTTDGDLGDLRRVGLPSSAKHTFNAVLGYEKGPISLRVAGAYRSKYLDELNDEADQDRYVASHFQLDLSAKYKVTENVQLFGEWVNVTDEPYFAYQNFGGSRRLLQYEEYSWTAKFGVKATF